MQSETQIFYLKWMKINLKDIRFAPQPEQTYIYASLSLYRLGIELVIIKSKYMKIN